MNETIKTDILAVIRKSIVAAESKNASLVRELSNHIIHNASIFQDEYSISTAVLIYSLSKVMERSNSNLREIIFLLKRAAESLTQNNDTQFEETTKKAMNIISHLDAQTPIYIEKVVIQAQIKKGSKIYDHGISMAKAASIMGISEWELARYIGNTVASDQIDNSIEVGKRLDFLRSLFKGDKK